MQIKLIDLFNGHFGNKIQKKLHEVLTPNDLYIYGSKLKNKKYDQIWSDLILLIWRENLQNYFDYTEEQKEVIYEFGDNIRLHLSKQLEDIDNKNGIISIFKLDLNVGVYHVDSFVDLEMHGDYFNQGDILEINNVDGIYYRNGIKGGYTKEIAITKIEHFQVFNDLISNYSTEIELSDPRNIPNHYDEYIDVENLNLNVGDYQIIKVKKDIDGGELDLEVYDNINKRNYFVSLYFDGTSKYDQNDYVSVFGDKLENFINKKQEYIIESLLEISKQNKINNGESLLTCTECYEDFTDPNLTTDDYCPLCGHHQLRKTY